MFCAERITYGLVLAIFTSNVDYQIFAMVTVTAIVSIIGLTRFLEYDMACSI